MTKTDQHELTAPQLMQATELALRITGTPAFASADYEGEIDSLQFIEADDVDESTWAFVPLPVDEDGHARTGCNCGHDHGERDQGIEGTRDRGSKVARDQGSDPGDHDESDGLDDQILCVDTALAAELIKSHLREWLAERGWQVQLEMLKKEHRWRLADCLSFTEGGGDRLEDDYPAGEDELKVLCESIVVVAREKG